MTPMQENIDKLTRGMADTFDSDYAKQVRVAMNVTGAEAKQFIDRYRVQVGLPPIFPREQYS